MVLVRHSLRNNLPSRNRNFPRCPGGKTAYKDNYLWFTSGGGIGDEIHLDNIFLWRDKDSVEESGIAAITPDSDTDNAPVEIYDLAGRRLSSMDMPGLYIVRQGNTVTKVIVR